MRKRKDTNNNPLPPFNKENIVVNEQIGQLILDAEENLKKHEGDFHFFFFWFSKSLGFCLLSIPSVPNKYTKKMNRGGQSRREKKKKVRKTPAMFLCLVSR